MNVIVVTLVALLASAPLQTVGASSQQQTFRAGTDYITFNLRVLDKGGKTPRTGLTIDDFQVKVDGRKRTLARVEVFKEGTPEHAYLLALEPLPSERDGKVHTMEVQVKGIRKTVQRAFSIER